MPNLIVDGSLCGDKPAEVDIDDLDGFDMGVTDDSTTKTEKYYTWDGKVRYRGRKPKKGMVQTKFRDAPKTCFQVQHPSSCPQVDPQRKDGVRVITLRHTKRNEVWLSLNDLQWAIRYLTVQHKLKGVKVVHDSDPGPGGAPDETSPTVEDDLSEHERIVDEMDQ